MRPRYIPVILPMRGIAALIVALHHLGFSTGVLSQYPNLHNTFELGRHGVELFFLISGLVIPLSLVSKSYRINRIHRFFAKRAVRIEPSYFAAVLLAITFIFVREEIFHDNAIAQPTLSQFLCNVFYLVPFTETEWLSPVFWTLGIELQFYILCSFIFGIGIRWDTRSSIVVVILSSTLSSFFFRDGAYILAWLDCFALGFVLCLFYLERISLKNTLLVVAIMSMFIALHRPVFVVMILVLASALILFQPKLSLGRQLKFLGKQSYSLYLTHCLTGTTVVNLLLRFAPKLTLQFPGVAILLGMLMAIGLAQILYSLIEKPTESFSKKITLNKRLNSDAVV